jgi:chromosome segregation ATPase
MLSGGAGPSRGASTSQSNGRQFVLPIPEVPASTSHAIRQALVGSVQPFAAQQNRIRILSTKLREQREKAKTCQQKIVDLEEQKEESLRDIRETRQQEAANTVAILERRLRNRYNKELTASRAAWQQQLEAECDAKRKAWHLERDEASSAKERNDADDLESVTKRAKSTELEQSATHDPSEGDSSMEASIEALVQPALAAIDIKSDGLKNELVETEAALERLNETRTEMIWLLKQVIKAEEKRKVDHKRSIGQF